MNMEVKNEYGIEYWNEYGIWIWKCIFTYIHNDQILGEFLSSSLSDIWGRNLPTLTCCLKRGEEREQMKEVRN